jgi:hypothetical protein
MRGRDIEKIRLKLRAIWGDNYVLFKVGEECSEVAHSVNKLLAVLCIPNNNPTDEGLLLAQLSEEFAQLKVYMELLEPLLLPETLHNARELKITNIHKKIKDYEKTG